MIPVMERRTLLTSQSAGSATFGISTRDTAHVMTILRDTLYMDKILAVIREYSSNAWDAHNDAGKCDVPISVTLPTIGDPTLSITDYGKGLSNDDVLGVFTQYGASTKRSSNTGVGMLGIGSKSGFAYSDSFTIVSRHDGVARTYIAAIGDDERGEITLLDEQPCSDTGLTIKIAVKQHDIPTFKATATEFFKHFEPRPVINADIPKDRLEWFGHGAVDPKHVALPSGQWLAKMGCVAYPVDTSQLNIPYSIRRLSGVLKFQIGELEVSASREGLKYSDLTKQRLEAKIIDLIDEYVAKVIAEIEATSTSQWERRCKAISLKEFLLPNSAQLVRDMTESSVDLGELPELKRWTENKPSYYRGDRSNVVMVNERSRVIIRDDRRSMSGFEFLESDLVLRPVKGADAHAAYDTITKRIQLLRATGLPLLKTSEMPWQQPERSPRAINLKAKQKVRFFELLRSDNYHSPLSHWWDIVERTPEPTDVWVEIESFRVINEADFYEKLIEDQRIATAFGVTLPRIFAYKVKKEEKSTTRDRIGVTYGVWREGLYDLVVSNSAKAARLIESRQLLSLTGENAPSSQAEIANIAKIAGEDHPIYKLIERVSLAARHMSEIDYQTRQSLTMLMRLNTSNASSAAKADLERAVKAAPLLTAQNEGIAVLWGNHANAWIEYARDSINRSYTEGASTCTSTH